MAMLIPLLLPHVVAAGANIGLGISNALQGDSSSVSFQIGNKVFTSKKSCNLGVLPPEIRSRIILMALEESKSLILPDHIISNPADPHFVQEMRELERIHPLNPNSTNYRSIVGDRVSANGYPISSWRWQLVNSEWREILQKPLWNHLEVKGYRPWENLVNVLGSDAGLAQAARVKELTLREGFRSPDQIYTIVSYDGFKNIKTIRILPDYPTSFSPAVWLTGMFPFGLQLVRASSQLDEFTYGMPLDTTTNPSSRQHLKTLHPRALGLTVLNPTIDLFEEIKKLVASTTEILTLRFVEGRGLPNPSIFLCEPLQAFKRIDVHLNLLRSKKIFVGTGPDRHLIDDPDPPGDRLVTQLVDALELSDEETQNRYRVWRIEDWNIPGQVHNATRTQIWPKRLLEIEGEAKQIAPPIEQIDGVSSNTVAGSSTTAAVTERWDRETNLRLLGGLINLRLESKKR